MRYGGIRRDMEEGIKWQLKFNNNKIRLWEGVAKKNCNTNIGIRFSKNGYPYELSEIFYTAITLGLITKKDVKTLLAEIKNYRTFIDKKTISTEHHSRLTINGISFEETSIKLPTLFMIETLDGAQVEVSIEKQQYASGVQPMIYFCIPIEAFENSSDILNRSSVLGDELIYVISKNNIQNLNSLMKVFGMASKRHNHDVVQIIQTLLEIA